MAKVLGETARYVTEQSIKKFKRQVIFVLLASFFLALVPGFLLGLIFNKQPYIWLTIFIFIIVILIVVIVFRFTDRISDRLERERTNFRKGATGELLVGYILEGLPNDYRIIPGIETPHGDIDHAVVGPTGVYAIDTKNWRGVVEADGKGELLLNGKPIDKPEVKNLLRRTMFLQEKVKALTALDPFIRAVLVFPAAYVEAKKGSTGYAHCVRADQLPRYVVEKRGEKLSDKEIEAISQTLDELARMDKNFAPDSK